jgi:hypothetical protein
MTDRESQILHAMDGALDRLRTPVGHDSGAYAAVYGALLPLCRDAYAERARSFERFRPAAEGETRLT